MLFWLVCIICGAATIQGSVSIDLSQCEDSETWNQQLERQCWRQFKKAYSKRYNPAWIEPWRRHIWKKNIQVIRSHNAGQRAPGSSETYRMGLNAHGDKTDREIRRYYLDSHEPITKKENYQSMPPAEKQAYNDWVNGYDNSYPVPGVQLPPRAASYPESWDWREKADCNTPVRDQMPCGSCYIVAALYVLECQWARKHNISRQLSAQHVVDCGRQNGRLSGCQGGFSYQVFVFLQGGVPTEKCYPYTGQPNEHCKSSCKKVAHTRTMKIARDNETAVKKIPVDKIRRAIVDIGPVVSSMAVLYRKFRWYKSGIYSDANCHLYMSNHAVTTIGYGPDFWLVKNTFGPTWGMNGYFKMSSDVKRNCNFHETMSTLTITK